MICPKCHSEQIDSSTICDSCGLVFAKYYKYHGEDTQETELVFHDDDTHGRLPRQLLFHRDKKVTHATLIGWILVLAGLIIWSFLFISSSIESNYAGESFMHLINLPFHEAGHILFRPFGAFMTSLGGTLMQILIAVICLVVFLFKTRDPFAASVALWWTGQNFLDIAPYINDARAGQLPLLGGNFGHSSPYGFHDWEFILNELGLLAHDNLIARISFVFGSLIMIAALAWGAMLVARYYKRT